MRIKRLHIEKMPGFPYGLKPYEEMANHINIIAGANGTGKSSTARVIQKLIWWDRKLNLHAVSELLIGNLTHQVTIDYPFYYHTDPQGSRSTEDFRSYVSESFEKQYILALHDLVKGDDRNLAREIIREVNGGFDLERAAASLAYSDGIYKTHRGEFLEYRDAGKAYQDIANEQEALKSKAQQLEKLREDAGKAKEAKDRKKYYEELAEWMQIREDRKKNKEQLAAFSPVLEHLRPDDQENIGQLEHKIAQGQEEIARLEQQIIDEDELLNQLNIPACGLDDAALDELENYREELREKKRLLEASQREVARLEAACRQAAAVISPVEEWRGEPVAAEELKALDAMTRQINRIEGEYLHLSDRRKALAAEIAGSEKECGNLPTDTEALNRGITELSRWLKQEKVSSSPERWVLWIQTLLGLLTAVAVALWGWYGLTGIGLMLLLLLYGLLQKKRGEANALLAAQTYYGELGLPFPANWESESVAAMAGQLVEQFHRAAALQELKRQEKELNASWYSCREKKDDVATKYREWAERFHLVDRFEQESDSYNTFYYLIKEVIQWQDASAALKKEQAYAGQLQTEYNALLAHANRLLFQWGRSEAETPEAVDAQLKELRKLGGERKELLSSLHNCNAALARNKKQSGEDQEALQAIYRRLSLNENTKEQLRELTSQLPEYNATRKKLDETAAVLADREQALEKFPFHQADLFATLSIEEIKATGTEYAREAENYEKLIEKVKTLELNIEQAQAGNTLEKAAERRDNAQRQLEATFEQNLQSVTGALIVDQLRQEISLNNENPIFREANKILGDITQQRYGLLLSDVKESVFRAIDNRSRQVLALEELSTGTRVQLLLAIRLAYIGSLEKNIKLPILADELLANSDDQRSEAIIRSLIEISRERQVFYFTAQGDEVGKWKSYLDQAEGIHSRVFILGEEAKMAGMQPAEIPLVRLIRDIPEPQSLSHKAYGELLQVPLFNLLEEPVENLHLWFLLDDDIHSLYSFLRRGITHWGQLRQLKEKGDTGNLSIEAWELLDRKIELIKEFAALYRRGRARRIDKEIIERSGAISEKFIDKVCDLLDTCAGDPLRLLQELPAIPRLQKSKMEDLRVYLLEQKYIDNNDALSPEEMHISLQAKISQLGIAVEEAQRLIARLTPEAGSG